MSCPPELVNYLIVEVSNDEAFATSETLIYPASLPDFPVNGTAGTSRWVRSKWRRSLDPLEESGWSNTVRLDFPRILAYEIESLPDPNALSYPLVPVIRTVLGWSEFIELSLIANQGGEGCRVGYGLSLSGAAGRTWIYVKNTSTSADVSIVEAALIIGQTAGTDCKGDSIVAAGWRPNDEFLAGSIADVSNYAPYIADPPVADINGSTGTIKYRKVLISPPPDVDPSHPDYACIATRCPESTDPGYDPRYGCINVFDVARTPAGFDLPGGSDYYVKVDAGICRAYNVYIDALGRTLFPPFLQVSLGGVGIFAGFTQYGTVYVKFSTGLSVYLPARDLSPELGGIVLEPSTTPTNLQLDDFFVFISETPFAEDLDSADGHWENAMIENALPDGVYLVMVSRSTNLLASNLNSAPLDPTKTYYFRVGARRFQNIAQTEFLYSTTLSAQVTGKLGTAARLNEALGGGTAEEIAASLHWKEPVPVVADLPGTDTAEAGDVHLVVADANGDPELRAYTDGDWRRVGGRRRFAFVFGVSGVPAVGTNKSFELVAPCDGEFTDWVARMKEAATGASTVGDIKKNGTTMWGFFPGNRPSVPSGATNATGSAFDTGQAEFSQGDVFTLDIVQIGSSTPGNRFQVQLNAKER